MHLTATAFTLLGFALLLCGLWFTARPEIPNQGNASAKILTERRVWAAIIASVGVCLVHHRAWPNTLVDYLTITVTLIIGAIIGRLIGTLVDENTKRQWFWLGFELILLIVTIGAYWHQTTAERI